MHNRIHDLVIDLVVKCTCPGPWGTAHGVCVCAEFLGLALGTRTSRARDGNTVVCEHYDNSLESRLVNVRHCDLTIKY